MVNQNDQYPLVSVVTVCRNAADTLPRTIESLQQQTETDFEWVFVDGASTDASVELARKAEVSAKKILSKPDDGIYYAMNKGLALARGRYVLFLNAGDSLHSPDTLAHICRAIRENGFPGVVYGQTDIVDADGHKISDRHLLAPECLTFKSFRNGMVVCHQAFVVLKGLVQHFDVEYRYSADYDWCVRCLQRSRCNVYLPETIADFLEGGATTRHHRESLRERFRIMSHHYGLLPTLFRHLFIFLPRTLLRHIRQ